MFCKPNVANRQANVLNTNNLSAKQAYCRTKCKRLAK